MKLLLILLIMTAFVISGALSFDNDVKSRFSNLYKTSSINTDSNTVEEYKTNYFEMLVKKNESLPGCVDVDADLFATATFQQGFPDECMEVRVDDDDHSFSHHIRREVKHSCSNSMTGRRQLSLMHLSKQKQELRQQYLLFLLDGHLTRMLLQIWTLIITL